VPQSETANSEASQLAAFVCDNGIYGRISLEYNELPRDGLTKIQSGRHPILADIFTIAPDLGSVELAGLNIARLIIVAPKKGGLSGHHCSIVSKGSLLLGAKKLATEIGHAVCQRQV
jgi:hypothetical protein